MRNIIIALTLLATTPYAAAQVSSPGGIVKSVDSITEEDVSYVKTFYNKGVYQCFDHWLNTWRIAGYTKLVDLVMQRDMVVFQAPIADVYVRCEYTRFVYVRPDGSELVGEYYTPERQR